jgi:hypothetical protein
MNNDKYIFDDIALEKECYHLMALFLSSAHVHKLKSEYPDSQFQIFSIYEPQEMKKLLISISIQLRMIDDLMKDHDRSGYLPNKAIGNIKFLNKNSTIDASIRDACNKIIHAKALNIITSDNPQIVLRGYDPQNGDWETIVFVLKFIESALDLVKSYDEDWDVSGYRY